jgi:hypothetical protein
MSGVGVPPSLRRVLGTATRTSQSHGSVCAGTPTPAPFEAEVARTARTGVPQRASYPLRAGSTSASDLTPGGGR